MKIQKNTPWLASFGLMLAGACGWQLSHSLFSANVAGTHPPSDAAFASPPGKSASTADQVPLLNDANIFVSLSKRVIPSVVNISTVSTVKMGYHPGQPPGGQPMSPEDLMRRFFGGGGGEEGFGQMMPRIREQKTAALGSGFVIDSSGIILTNNHVVANADEIKIQFTENPDEVPTSGKVIGRDPDLDVALIKVKTTHPLIALPLGDSEALNVGEYVMAAGNPYGQGHSVSHGIVSAKGRLAPGMPLANYLQIDAPINPGNSGGPLMNLKGEVIGINNAIDPRAQGIGFAIPINLVKKVLPELQSDGKVSRGYIGAVVGPLGPEVAEKLGVPKDTHAPFITEIMPGSPADLAGLKPYDAVIEVASTIVHTPADLVTAVSSAPIGKPIPVKVFRSGKIETLTIRTKAKPGAESVAENKNDRETSGAMRSQEVATRALTGLTVTPNPEPGQKGVVVTEVASGSPAERAGLTEGDLILEVDRKIVSDPKSFRSEISQKNKSYLLRVLKREMSGAKLFSVLILDLKEAEAG